MTSDVSLDTRRSLLSRLGHLDDQESWQTFFELYWRILYNVARRAGLDDPDAQDVVQDTVMTVARELPEFRYDPARGSFKHWLFLIVRRRVADHLRRVYRQAARVRMSPAALEKRAEADGETAEQRIGEMWDQEWQQSVLDAAIAQVRTQVSPKQFQLFDYCVLKEWPVARVARALGVSSAQVYLARHRVSQVVKRAAHSIEEERSKGRLS
jgi:RNA polymerase sigma factor (sigma-70 family)